MVLVSERISSGKPINVMPTLIKARHLFRRRRHSNLLLLIKPQYENEAAERPQNENEATKNSKNENEATEKPHNEKEATENQNGKDSKGHQDALS